MLPFGLALVVFLFVIGAPIMVAFGLGGALLLLFLYHIPPSSIATAMFTRLDSYVFMAGPFFILAGNLLIAGGGIKQAIKFFDAWTGHLPGGLLIVVVLFCTVFAAITGSPIAAIVAVGPLLFPEMLEHGYSRSLSAGIITVAALLGPIIPPSVIMIIFASLIEISGGALFACGMIPGLMMAFIMLVVGVIICRVRRYPVKERVGWKDRGTATFKALPFIAMPVVVLGGIYTGYFTPTEAATVAIVFTIVIGLIYRGITWPKIWRASVQSAQSAASIYLLLAGIAVFSHALHLSGIPAHLAEIIVQIEMTPLMFVIASSVVFFILGFFIPPMATMLMMLPLIMPVLEALNINLYWYATIWIINIELGGLTPPFAYSIFVASRILNTSFEDIVKGEIPFAPAVLAVMILIIFVPDVALWLPRMMGMPVGVVG